MNSRRRALIWLLGSAAAAAAWYAARRHALLPVPDSVATDLGDVLAPVAGNEGFARADAPRPFAFPRDHGPHLDYRSEWWYFTGHLQTNSGRPFGFQLTLFRFELARTVAASPSAWRTPRILLGHFALSDIDDKRFHAFERLSRALPGIAGVSASPPAVWLDDWRIALVTDAADERFTLQAGERGIALALTLKPSSNVVAQGEQGLSRKSAARGNASYYYSIPRLAAQGTLALPSGAHAVTGSAWLDREWSTSALARSQVGWDWFALQLNDGSALMFYRLRERDGTASSYSAGSLVTARGHVQPLSAADVIIEERAYWDSADSGRRYPAAWRLTLERHGLRLDLLPRLAAQEWRARFAYWEGAVTVSSAGRPAGLGYVELTGY